MEWSKRRSDSQNDGKSKINANFCVFCDIYTCTYTNNITGNTVNNISSVCNRGCCNYKNKEHNNMQNNEFFGTQRRQI